MNLRVSWGKEKQIIVSSMYTTTNQFEQIYVYKDKSITSQIGIRNYRVFSFFCMVPILFPPLTTNSNVSTVVHIYLMKAIFWIHCSNKRIPSILL